MMRDPICGMTGILERHGQWFCSEPCIEEYERRQAAPPPPDSSGSGGEACPIGARPWWTNPWMWVPLTGLLLATVGWWWPAAAGVSAIYRSYLRKIFLPFLAGLLLGGVIDHFVPRAYIVRWLSGSRKRVIARATLLGFLASSCSHGCLELSLELYRKGASVPAVVSFLLASPWASMSLTLILLGLFGLRGVVIIVGALVIAFLTGLIFQRLARRGLIETNPNTQPLDEGFSIRQDIIARWRQYRWTPQQFAADARGILAGMIPLGRMVLGWVQLGLILSAAFGALLPHPLIERFLGPSFGGLLLTILVATIIEVCSEGTAPLAFELYRHTGALGNAFAFLMGGVVTDYTELGALWATIGRRTVFWLVLVTLPLVIIAGVLLNWLGGHG